MSEWTKGPWRAADRDNCEERGVPIFATNKAGLPYYIGWAAYMGTADKAPALANARLIAAAPELVEALEMCLGVIRHLRYLDGASVEQKRAEDVLAKVKG